jgi:hypothetical protein
VLVFLSVTIFLFTACSRDVFDLPLTYKFVRSDGQDFVSNPGFSKVAKLIIDNYQPFDTLGVYLDVNCKIELVRDQQLKVLPYSVFLYLREGENNFYVKRIKNRSGFTSCTLVASYFRFVNIPAPIVSGFGQSINISYDDSGLSRDWIANMFVQNGELVFNWIPFSSTFDLKNSSSTIIKLRFTDQDGVVGDESVGINYVVKSPCDGLPGGSWIYVPKLSESLASGLDERADAFSDDSHRVGDGFCVMKFHARDVDGIPFSTADGLPITDISASSADELCKRLGSKFGLITNAQWMTLALNIESQDKNWFDIATDEVSVRGGANAYINSGHNGETPVLDGNDSQGGEFKRFHEVTSSFTGIDTTVFDLAGNFFDLVYFDANTVATPLPFPLLSTNSYPWYFTIPETDSSVLLNQFIPQTVLDVGFDTAGYPNRHLGYLDFTSGHTSIIRGGDYLSGSFASIFSVKFISQDTGGPSVAARCTWAP